MAAMEAKRATCVSVVLPVRDGAATIRSALESLRRQTLGDWEAVVVDDGSRDGTAGLVEAMAREEGRIRLVRQEGLGLVAALERGIGAARGELIARMDADDWCAPERLERQVAALERDRRLGLVGCRVRFGGDRVQQAGYALHVDWLNSLMGHEEIALNRFVESPLAHPSVMFRREMVDRFGGYRAGLFPEDYELWLRWLEAGVRMEKVPGELLTWNDAPHRLSRSDPRYAPEAFYEVKAPYLARATEGIRRGRAVWVWGAGRPTRLRAEALGRLGVEIAGYIDIDPRKAGRSIRGRPVVGLAGVPSPREAVVLIYVAKRGARELIRGWLGERGFREGEDFWAAA